MANRRTQKKREREKLKKSQNFFDYKFSPVKEALAEIKKEGESPNGDTETRTRVSGGATVPSRESFGY